MKRTAAVLGGDLRQVWLARLLLEDGFDVVTWGLEQGTENLVIGYLFLK